MHLVHILLAVRCPHCAQGRILVDFGRADLLLVIVNDTVMIIIIWKYYWIPSAIKLYLHNFIKFSEFLLNQMNFQVMLIYHTYHRKLNCPDQIYIKRGLKIRPKS